MRYPFLVKNDSEYVMEMIERYLTMIVIHHVCPHAVLHLATFFMSIVVSALYSSVRHTVQYRTLSKGFATAIHYYCTLLYSTP